MNKYLIVIGLLLMQDSFANPFENFSEVSGSYLGACYGVEYLKKSKCELINSESIENCLNKITSLVPSSHSIEFSRALLEVKQSIKNNAIINIDKGFKKTLFINKNNLNETCLSYGSSLLTYQNLKFEEAKRISKWIK
jgi:hypothetical protein